METNQRRRFFVPFHGTALTVAALCAASAHGEVKVASPFTDHMVLQRDKKLPVWGTATAGESVAVTAGDDKATATADAQGKWSVTLDPLKASEQPIDVTIAGSNTVTLHDVLVGDVWICSGQSNMEFQLGGGTFGFGGVHNASEEIPKSDHPTLRLFILKKKIAFDPQSDCGGEWMVSTPENAPKFSGVGYFFGVNIQADQHVPVGLIGTYWGGQPAQAFTSIDGLKAEPTLSDFVKTFESDKQNLVANMEQFKNVTLPEWEKADAQWKQTIGAEYEENLKKWRVEAEAAKKDGKPLPAKPTPSKPETRKPSAPDQTASVPTVLYNGMINPLVPMAVKGAIWYQGESNAGAPVQYQTLFPAMITDWRNHFAEGDFPFLWVQLANFQARSDQPTQSPTGWAGLREAQSMTLKLPNTGQAVIIDIGQAEDIHPKDKADVGKRLALAARHVAYGEDIVYSGPTFDSLSVSGNKATVSFKNVGAGLTIAAAPATQMSVPAAEPASSLKGFSIAGEDQKFYWAAATIEGDKIVVTSDQVPTPVAVRYGWATNPEVNLYNKEGLPASPFRTDTWAEKRAPAGK